MGLEQSKDKMHCNRYMNGKGPPSLEDQANKSSVKRSFVGVEGIQPEGKMTWVILHRDLPGYPDDNTIQINYVFGDGIQTEKHPNPGQKFTGLRTLAYLPDNREGKKVLKLLEKAFNHGLLFTVATNESGEEVITWADIPHKTIFDGGASKSDSYPDPEYLKTVTRALKEKGVR